MNSVKLKYKNFLNSKKGTTLYNCFKEILYTNDDSLVNYLNKYILTKDFVPSKKQLSICDIGGGDGRRIMQILKFLNEKYNKTFRLDFIEQSRVFCADFQANLSIIKPFTTISIQNSIFEESKLNGPYDFIFLIHSIFALRDPEVIVKLISLLTSEGKLILISNAKDSFLGKLKTILDKHYDDNRVEIEDIKKKLLNKNIFYQKKNFYTRWNLKENDFYSKLNIILNWLSLGEFNSFSEIQKKEIYNLIFSLIKVKNNLYYFSEKEEIIIIPSTIH